jgi:dolichyl-phosphate-mannose--protein O-mannosyl transferase
LYALAAIGLLYVWDGFTRRDASIWRVAGPFVPSAAIVAASVVVIPLAIYVATYIPYFTLGHSFSEFLRLQYNMFNYHATLKATHPFGSPWWGWPFGYKAVYFYVHSTGARRAEIWTIQNLAVTWGGLIGMGFLVDRVRRSRSVALALVLVGALVQYLPWIPVSRVTFMYHYLPVVPFLTIAFGWWLAVEMRDQKHQKTAIAVACGTAVAMFVFIYPMLVGWLMPIRYLDLVRTMLPWVVP